MEMALKENSQAAFGALHDRYKAGVCSFISRYVQGHEEIEDICMVSFEKAFKQLASYNGQNKFSTWLFTIAKNTAIDFNDRASTRARKFEADDIDLSEQAIELPDGTSSPEEEIIRTQDHEQLMSCIENLPEHYRIVAKMCLIDNLGYKEIAEEADIPINTVKTRVARAKGLLMRMMLDLDE